MRQELQYGLLSEVRTCLHMSDVLRMICEWYIPCYIERLKVSPACRGPEVSVVVRGSGLTGPQKPCSMALSSKSIIDDKESLQQRAPLPRN